MSDASLLPPNASPLERNLSQLTAQISAIPAPFTALYSIDECPVPFLPWLAWSRRVEFWSTSWTEDQKRDAIRQSKTYNQQRGTRASLQYALDQFGPGWQIHAWHELTPKGAPFTFVVSNPGSASLTIDDVQNLNTLLDATKSARDFYQIQATITTQATFLVIGAAHTFDSIQIATKDV